MTTPETVRARRGGVRLHGVDKTYGTGEATVAALQGIDLDIEEGQFVAIVGESGSGKTTLLNVIGGIESADGGSIVVAGEDISGRKPHTLSEFRRDHVGFIFQFFNLIPTLTAQENVEVIVELTGRGDRGRAGELLALMGLAERTRNFPGQLSGGQQQRVAIARALIADPDLLLADEPMGALDVTTGQRVLGLLQQANRSDGRGVIMVTHNKVAAEVADRVVHMRDGVIVDDRRNQNPAEAADVRW